MLQLCVKHGGSLDLGKTHKQAKFQTECNSEHELHTFFSFEFLREESQILQDLIFELEYKRQLSFVNAWS